MSGPSSRPLPAAPVAACGFLERDGGHCLYWEQSGRPDGMAAVFLHGGPGAGSAPVHRRFFDPRHYRIVLFDQRGAGRSTPPAGIEANTTWHLVDDMEALRRHLGIERWLVFGGSWGATLALAYGIRHPERCAGFVLRGVFLGRDEEVDWFLHGMGRVFPEAGRAFTEFLPAAERGDLLAAYHARLTDPDPARHRPAARAWAAYETACSTLLPMPADGAALALNDAAALSLARLSAHYFRHRLFLADSPLLDNLAAIRRLPCVIVQGRYDMVCPIATAEALHRAWPGSELAEVPDAGHSAFEPGVRAALVAATERMKRLL
ncbi:MAG: prolyl aminopeptidase [Rhodospirillales bacterium]|nr:prolyl aminopeptidase [Rhodospirillales bacterium]